MKLTQLSAAAISAALLVNIAHAAPEARRERRPEPPPSRRDAPPPEAFERILDEDQRAELRDAFRENRERLREIDEQVRTGRRELHEAIVNGKTDESELKEKIEGIAKLEAERQFMRVKALAKIRPSLSEEQVARMKELHARRERMGRDLPPGPGRPREFQPDPGARERHREGIAPRPGDAELDQRRDRRHGERFERHEDQPPPPRRDRPPRRESERGPAHDDFKEHQDPPPPPSRERPEPE